MPRVYVSIGSNISKEKNIAACLDALEQLFGELQLSTIYESEAVGFGGDNFYNLVAGFDCDKPVGLLSAQLRQVEANNGRRRDGPKFSPRTLDIDILTYDELEGVVDGIKLPRDEILENAFVLLPLAEVAGEQRHPQLKETYNMLWDRFDKSTQNLWPVNFNWRGRHISKSNS